MKDEQVIISVSGGLDSTTLLAHYIDNGYDVIPVTFNYGSKHNKWENKSINNIIDYYNSLDNVELPPLQTIDLTFINQLFKSNLLLNNDNKIPFGEHYNSENIKKTVVPARNLIFASILAGYADSIGATMIAFGVHMDDHETYKDCRPEFLDSLYESIILATENEIKLEAILTYMTKTDIVNLGNALKIPFELTRSCYCDSELSCGKCSTCLSRLQAFKNNKLKDPIQYA